MKLDDCGGEEDKSISIFLFVKSHSYNERDVVAISVSITRYTAGL